MATAVGRVPGAADEALGLERVEQADEVRRVDPQALGELLLGERAGVAEDMEGGELVAAHAEALERGGEPPARGPRQAHQQQAAGGFVLLAVGALAIAITIAANGYGS